MRVLGPARRVEQHALFEVWSSVKYRKRIAAILATIAISCGSSGIGIALSNNSATATVKPHKPAAVAVHYPADLQRLKIQEETSLPAIQQPSSYQVKQGDTLASISSSISGSAANWPALWYANRSQIKNPDVISTGQTLALPASWSVPSWMKKQAQAAIPAVAAPAQVAVAMAPAAPSAAVPAGSLQTYALSLLGDSQTQFSCLNSIIMRESSWNVYAANPSGAYGIPQALPGSKMAAAGPDWATNGDTQLRWMIKIYIPATYGTACNAWAHEQAYGSY